MAGVGIVAVLVGVVVLAALLQTLQPESALYGTPEVTKFKGGRASAFTLQFDDSMEAQAEFAIPELNKRGLVGTFFVNPGLDRHKRNLRVWEEVCPQSGHELANHTLHHQSAKDVDDADREIGECSRYIWSLYPHKSKLLPFLGGGGTTWSIPPEALPELMRRHCLFLGFDFRRLHRPDAPPDARLRGIWQCNIPSAAKRVGSSEEKGTGRCVAAAEEALAEGTWVQVGFHGVGGQWISTSAEHYLELLDYLVAHRDRIWVGTTGQVFRYREERDAVRAVTLSDASERGFDSSIECDETKVETYGRPFADLYDEPLTVCVEVPDAWRAFTVAQGDQSAEGEAVLLSGRRCALIDVRPNRGPATVTRRPA